VLFFGVFWAFGFIGGMGKLAEPPAGSISYGFVLRGVPNCARSPAVPFGI